MTRGSAPEHFLNASAHSTAMVQAIKKLIAAITKRTREKERMFGAKIVTISMNVPESHKFRIYLERQTITSLFIHNIHMHVCGQFRKEVCLLLCLGLSSDYLLRGI